jgi:hypothetical protein
MPSDANGQPEVLEYGQPAQRWKWNAEWAWIGAAALGILQIPWFLFGGVMVEEWQSYKQVQFVRDSLLDLLQILPTFAALFVAGLGVASARRNHNKGALILCMIVIALSGLVLLFATCDWYYNVYNGTGTWDPF